MPGFTVEIGALVRGSRTNMINSFGSCDTNRGLETPGLKIWEFEAGTYAPDGEIFTASILVCPGVVFNQPEQFSFSFVAGRRPRHGVCYC